MAANRFDQLIDQWEPRLRKAFLDSVHKLRDTAQIEALVRSLEAGDVETALRAVGLDPVSFRELDRTIAQAYEAGGLASIAPVPRTRDADGLRIIVQFNVRNIRAEQWLQTHSSALVRDILEDQRLMIRRRLTAGLQVGANPRTTALDLVGRVSSVTGRREGGLIGLTSSQEQWVRNYEAELSDPAKMSNALTRKLRDARFDASVAKAIRNNEAVPAELRDKMIRTYRNRALRYRAEVIARTESMAALHTAQEEAMRQAIDGGAVNKGAVTSAWRTARDKRVRETHEAMEGQTVVMGESFVSPSGARLRFPGDPEAPIEETAQCRCWREFKIDFFAGVK